MPDNHIAFAADLAGADGPDGKMKLFRGTDIANYSRAQKHLAVSADASVIRYPLHRDNRTHHSFAVFGGGDQNTAKAPVKGLFTPIHKAKGITVSDWADSYKPKINGRTPKLEELTFLRHCP